MELTNGNCYSLSLFSLIQKHSTLRQRPHTAYNKPHTATHCQKLWFLLKGPGMIMNSPIEYNSKSKNEKNLAVGIPLGNSLPDPTARTTEF